MALFSRRSKNDSDAPESESAPAAGEEPTPAASATTPPDATEPSESAPSDGAEGSEESGPAAPEAAPAESVPHVSISVSTFGQDPTAPPRPVKPRAASTAPEVTHSVPGMPDNVLLRQALDEIGEDPQPVDVMNVARQALQGQLYVRVKGDAAELLAKGESLALAATTAGEHRFLLAFTGGDALQAALAADGDTDTSAIGQPSQVVLSHVLGAAYAGLVFDHASDRGHVVLPTPLVQKALEEGDPESTLKNLLSGPRTEATATEVIDALTRVKLWVAAGPADEEGQFGVAESRTADGQRRLEVFSHPLEVLALGRGDRPLPLTGAMLGQALLADEGVTGIIVDPAGPWIELDREVLAPLLALAEDETEPAGEEG